MNIAPVEWMIMRRTSSPIALRLSFDCVDQRSGVGSRPSTTRCDFNASHNFFFLKPTFTEDTLFSLEFATENAVISVLSAQTELESIEVVRGKEAVTHATFPRIVVECSKPLKYVHGKINVIVNVPQDKTSVKYDQKIIKMNGYRVYSIGWNKQDDGGLFGVVKENFYCDPGFTIVLSK
jgi:hypothetical protein